MPEALGATGLRRHDQGSPKSLSRTGRNVFPLGWPMTPVPTSSHHRQQPGPCWPTYPTVTVLGAVSDQGQDVRQSTGFRSNPHWKGEDPASPPCPSKLHWIQLQLLRRHPRSLSGSAGCYPPSHPSGAADERRPSRPHVGDDGVELSEQTRSGPAIIHPRKDGLDKIHPNQSQHFFLMVRGKKKSPTWKQAKGCPRTIPKATLELCRVYPRVLALMTYYPAMIKYLITPSGQMSALEN